LKAQIYIFLGQKVLKSDIEQILFMK